MANDILWGTNGKTVNQGVIWGYSSFLMKREVNLPVESVDIPWPMSITSQEEQVLRRSM